MFLLILLFLGWIFFFDGLETIKQYTGNDSCKSYSDYTCKQLENSTYNAFFYFPDDTEYYLGTVYSLSGCGRAANRYASSKNLSRSDGWGYICCLKTSNSNCAEKHR